jgi:hypothetical protein
MRPEACAPTLSGNGLLAVTVSEPQQRRDVDTGLIEKVGNANLPAKDTRSWRERLWEWACAITRPPAPAFIGPLEEPPERGEAPRTGICCSGGGIRSAAFNLGALQSLRADDELQNAKYVSAVSGGSYIAAALAAVGLRWDPKTNGGQTPTKEQRGWDDSDPRLFDRTTPPFYPGSPEEQYLRNRSTYIAPTGVAKLYLALRIAGGLVWNLVFLGLAVFAAGIAAGLFYRSYGALDPDPSGNPIPWYAWGPPAALIAAGTLLGLLYMIRPIHSESARRPMLAWIMRLLIAGAGVGLVLVVVPLFLIAIRNGLVSDEPNFGDGAALATWGSLATVIAGVIAQLRSRVDTRKEQLAELGKVSKRWTKLSAGARKLLAYAAAAIAVPLLALLGFALAARLAVAGDADSLPLILGGGALAAFAFLYFFCDLTTWSLHPFYKRRLASVFALKRVRRDGRLDDTRGTAVERDYDHLPWIKEADIHRDGDPWPVLLVCAAANVSDVGATPPGRSVTSFTFSPGAIGGPLVGAVRPEEYESHLDDKWARRQVTLMTAVAVSGAALSPSMGKETRWALRALMALANVRLGVWMGNPRRLEDTRRRPRPRPHYLLAELLGRNSVRGKFLYVTDGGHYENLGLVELLRRGCTRIFCFDASGGKSLAALGDAVALARSEVGVEIDIDPDDLAPGKDGMAKSDFVVGDITYRAREPGDANRRGKLVYVRTVLTENAPFDVQAFHEEDELFPNHPTTDQLYTDQKFEAYRALGESAARRSRQALVAQEAPAGGALVATFIEISQTTTE